jgi:hypothetical protein
MRKVKNLALLILSLASFISGGICLLQGNAKEITINFTQEFSARDLVIKKISASSENDKIVFTILYESQKDRFLSLFNAPQGDKLKYFDPTFIRKHQKSARFAIPRNQFKDVSHISMAFSDNADPERDINLVYLKIYEKDVLNLLGMNSKHIAHNIPKVKIFNSVKECKDVRWGDLTKITTPLSFDFISTLWFNLDTKFGKFTDLSKAVLEKGKNPGLGVKSIHKRGIMGKGVNVAIIDFNVCFGHPEYLGKVVQYKDVGCDMLPNKGSMHAPAVLSVLAGDTMGTAPDVRVYFAASPSWALDAKYEAEALEWILEANQSLPEHSKIKVVSVSGNHSGKSYPFCKNGKLWNKAVKKAQKEGILVLDFTPDHGIIGPCYYDIHDPDNLSKCRIGFPVMLVKKHWSKKIVYAPCIFRTTAEEYTDGNPSYQYLGGIPYSGQGGESLSIPYVAGVLALGWQVKPDLKADEIVKLLFKTAYVTADGYKIINPVAFIDAIKRL